MHRPLEIVTTLIVFAVVMTGIGWAVDASTPAVHGWLIDHLGQAGFWSVFIVLWLAAGLYAWRGHRAPKGGADRAAGK